MHRVFLDHQSSTRVHPEVLEAMLPFFRERFGSPSSLHQDGLHARTALSQARERIATFIGAEHPEEILFTSGATEAANLAIKGTAYAQPRRNHLVVTSTEHPSVLESVAFLETQGFTATRVPVDACGLVDPQAVAAAITERTCLISVHHVNHDIGAIQAIEEIGKIAGERGVGFFVDAAASGGWLPIDVRAMGASLLSLAPHRFYGPKGVGILYRNRRARLAGQIHGGIQEEGRRAGTENVPAIVGAGVAAVLATRELAERGHKTRSLQRRLWEGIRKEIRYVRLNGPEIGQARLSTNLNISTEFVEGEGQALSLDMKGIAVASGAACLSRSMKIPHVLAAIGLEHSLAKANLIFSLGSENTEEEIDYTIAAFKETVERLRGMSPLWDEFQRGELDSVIEPRNGLSGGRKALAES